MIRKVQKDDLDKLRKQPGVKVQEQPKPKVKAAAPAPQVATKPPETLKLDTETLEQLSSLVAAHEKAQGRFLAQMDLLVERLAKRNVDLKFEVTDRDHNGDIKGFRMKSDNLSIH